MDLQVRRLSLSGQPLSVLSHPHRKAEVEIPMLQLVPLAPLSRAWLHPHSPSLQLFIHMDTTSCTFSNVH